MDNPWNLVLERLRLVIDAEDFRRWFGETVYASDSGDQISVWVPTEAQRKHLAIHFQNVIDDALDAIGRADTQIRFIVTGIGEDEDEDEEGI